MTNILNREFYLEVAAGNVTGHEVMQFSARNRAIGKQFKDIWGGGYFWTLAYTGLTGSFTPGQIIAGATSLATAIVVIDDNTGTTGTLTIKQLEGTFNAAETITDGSGSSTTNGDAVENKKIVFPTDGRRWEVLSSSEDDKVDGTGMRSLLINCLDTDYVRQNELVALNGTTPVLMNLTTAFRFDQLSLGAIGVTWGSTGENQGDIIIRDSVTKDIVAIIERDDSVVEDSNGLNVSAEGCWTIPAGKTGYPLFLSSATSKNLDAVIRSRLRTFGSTGFLSSGEQPIYQSNFIEDISMGPSPIPEKSDVVFFARSENIAVAVQVQMILLLIDNE